MTILLVGSEGFIGSHIREYFRSKSFKVICCDIINKNEEDYYYLDSVRNDYSYFFKELHIDVCINAAGSANVAYSFQYPEKDFELNVSIVISLLGAIKNFSPSCRFVNFSSAAVYGNPSELPVKESSKLRPLSPYGYHKMLSEKLLLEYHRFFDLKTCSLRVFSAYGPGLKKQLLWDMFQKSTGNEVLRLYGTGNESRDFIYITDLVKALELIIINAEFKGEAVNIASGIETSVMDAALFFLKYFNKPINLEFNGEIREGDPLHWRADISILKKMNFIPEVTIEKGISNYVKWLAVN